LTAINLNIFLRKIRSDLVSDPDPTYPEISGSGRIRIYNNCNITRKQGSAIMANFTYKERHKIAHMQILQRKTVQHFLETLTQNSQETTKIHLAYRKNV
jgi:hypothetical protein